MEKTNFSYFTSLFFFPPQANGTSRCHWWVWIANIFGPTIDLVFCTSMTPCKGPSTTRMCTLNPWCSNPFCSFWVNLGCLNTEPHRVFGALGNIHHDNFRNTYIRSMDQASPSVSYRGCCSTSSQWFFRVTSLTKGYPHQCQPPPKNKALVRPF